MILVALLTVLAVGGLLAWPAELLHKNLPRWIALVTMIIELILALVLWIGHADSVALSPHGAWLAEFAIPWIPRFGIGFHLAIDGLSLVLVVLSAFLGIVAVLCSWHEIQKQVGFFHFNLVWTVLGSIGVFLALDMFLFFFLWELMLVPMYFLIAIWGHENRRYASIKFFIFTQGSGLLMLLSILALVVVHYLDTGVLSFDYFELLGTTMARGPALWMMLGFFIAFAVKLPVVPFHSWLPDAHTEAPTAGSVLLAGVLLKTGAYGMFRFVVPLFPDAAAYFAPVAIALGVAGVVYGAVLAFAQSDLKRLVAYTSVSHLGFVLIGVFAWQALALSGAVVQMLAHGISTSALFVIVGALQERTHTRDMAKLGGLWATIPRMAAITLFFALAALGLPGTGDFVGEFLVLLGTYPVSLVATVIATLGLITAMVYALALIQRNFHGNNSSGWQLSDSSARETLTLAAMVVVTLWLGLYPQPVLDAAAPALRALQTLAARGG